MNSHCSTPGAKPALSNVPTYVVIAGIVWVTSLAYGFLLLLLHDFDARKAEPMKPIDLALVSQVVHRSDAVHLIVAVHPKCPCTQNTLNELERLLAHATEEYYVTALAFVPTEHSSPEDQRQWLVSTNIDSIQRLQHFEIVNDLGGEIAADLEMEISGTIAVLGKDGDTIFRGGITGSRSCVADNVGSQTLARILAGKTVSQTVTPVFGCSIGGKND